jgi:single-strand DNA-binding protein
MSGVNRVILLGRLGGDPEVKTLTNGMTIANFSVATSKEWKDDSGEKQSKTEWHRIVAFKKTAELVGKYLAKGRQVYVEGELQTRSWEKDGEKKYATEIVAQNVQFISDGRGKEESAETESPAALAEPAQAPTPKRVKTSDPDEIPF